MGLKIKKYLFLICILSFNAFANGQLTNISPNVLIYSEYYPNPSAKFKGTIIFENGSGTDISEWKDNKIFFDCAKKQGSVFLYDRNGLGKSPPDFQLSPDNPLTAKLVSDKLAMLLKQQNVKPPYLFVAHSYGAMYVGYFILKNSSLVKGILLVDPVPRDFNFSAKRIQKFNKGIEEAKMKPATYIYKNYSGSDAETIYQLLGFNESKRSIKILGNINDTIPIIIISATGMEKEQPLVEDWYTSQKQWLNNNHMSRIIQVSSDHFIQLRKPEKVCHELKQILNISNP